MTILTIAQRCQLTDVDPDYSIITGNAEGDNIELDIQDDYVLRRALALLKANKRRLSQQRISKLLHALDTLQYFIDTTYD